ncbi:MULTISPECIES: LexA family protein [Acinetobacter calcoaceticus/baumannii complex]|uniref:LexA family protein n=1 Tax=Acinetobacter calcoaceticus/baumannii complex TaxID=909768 RepID=UPI0010FF433C|nr:MULTISPECIES: S24 family peptidase [Acinetobacter calcoaceticus/baumannii complex]EHU1447026.1 helix-turn-helix domain-containing protein [Acinetobacter baumannii]EHU2668544.1 helix-turn-helix domain-containing protein [Acinetobacter baumannii]EHU3279276.1 helix-turn-helix domain-containing protein [Acinetobacter baumannii]EIB6918898.1 helix-turn-helix domain-containing protein [Acinetobacter baumannii]EKV4358427.1 helix-turn-helix domain-containing protein [Acinetobacter baumannii]
METLGTRLKNLRKSKKLTQQQIADAIGVSKTSVIYWEKDENLPKHDSLMALAQILGVTSNYLLYGKEDDSLDRNVTAPFPISGRLVPVISWVQAGTWTAADSVPLDTQFKEWLPPNPKCGKNGYGLIVVGESMSPDFRPSDKIYVNPDFQISDLKTGDLVIVACDGETEATFKKLIVESNGMYLEPLNPKWHEKIIPLREGCKLVGKVVGLYRDV